MADYDTIVNNQIAFAEKYTTKGVTTFDDGLARANIFAQAGVTITNRTVGQHTPATLNLEAIEAITPFNMPATYTLTTTGLFQQNPPEGMVGAFG